MAFVADDLAAWLLGLLADRGRRRLTTVLLGTDQEPALRSDATAVVGLTALELSPENDEQAEQVALVISQVFNQPVPDAPMAEHQTLLEALQAGIATCWKYPARCWPRRSPSTCCGRWLSEDHGAGHCSR
jgi:hypothetical protein